MLASPPSDLRDIRGLWEIQDYSLYFFIGVIVFICIVILILFLYIKKLQKEKLEHDLRVNINNFSLMSISNSKEFAYESTKILHKIIYAFELKPSKNPFIKKYKLEDIEEIKTNITDFIKLVDEYKYTPKYDEQINKDIKKAYDDLIGRFYVYT